LGAKFLIQSFEVVGAMRPSGHTTAVHLRTNP